MATTRRNRPRKVVILGMMSRIPVAGVVWQNLHYLLGFERLGFQAGFTQTCDAPWVVLWTLGQLCV